MKGKLRQTYRFKDKTYNNNYCISNYDVPGEINSLIIKTN